MGGAEGGQGPNRRNAATARRRKGINLVTHNPRNNSQALPALQGLGLSYPRALSGASRRTFCLATSASRRTASHGQTGGRGSVVSLSHPGLASLVPG